MTQAKRRLPVLQNRPDDGPERPRWQWVLIGAGATAIAWWLFMGTALMVLPLGRWAIVPFLSVATGAFLGGLMVGRFGGRAGPREAGLGAMIPALAASVDAFRFPADASFAWHALVLLVQAALSFGPGYLGGALGVRLRRK